MKRVVYSCRTSLCVFWFNPLLFWPPKGKNRTKHLNHIKPKDLGGEDRGLKMEDGAETPPAASFGSTPSSIFHSRLKELDLDR
jgi:hypothetical protein